MNPDQGAAGRQGRRAVSRTRPGCARSARSRGGAAAPRRAPRCSRRARAAPRTEPGASRGREDLGDAGGKVLDPAAFDDEAGLPVVDQRRQPADRRGDDRGAAGGGLEGDQTERLGAARDEADVGRPVVGGEQLVRLRRRRMRPSRRARGPAASRWSASQLASPRGTARPADDYEPGVSTPRRASSSSVRTRDVRPFQRLDPTDEEQERRLGSKSERPTSLGLVARARRRRGRRPGATISTRRGSAP